MGWTKCSDALPDEGRRVICTVYGHDVIIPKRGESIEDAIKRIMDIGWVTVGYLAPDGWCSWDGWPMIVTPYAWMPMPDPCPKEEGNE